jgi:hypothetical protein
MSLFYTTLGVCFVDETVYKINMVAALLMGMLIVLCWWWYTNVQKKE